MFEVGFFNQLLKFKKCKLDIIVVVGYSKIANYSE